MHSLKGCTHRVMEALHISIHRKGLSICGYTYPLRSFAIYDLERLLKLLEMAFNQVQTCLIFSFQWAHFPIKNSNKAQWVPIFDEFQWLSISLPIFKSKGPFLMKKLSFNGNTISFR